jgi:hypothetical protein
MATDTRSLPAFIDTDATFRTWGSGINAQLAAVGLVKTADTGQIDWTTALRPAVGVYAGYEVWRFADALQATHPVFIKIEYGIGGAADIPRLAVTVGAATNGAGTLSQAGTRQVLGISTSTTAGVMRVSYCSGSASRLFLVTHASPASSSSTMILVVERPKNAAGVEQAGSIIFATAYGTTATWQIVAHSGGSFAALNNWAGLAPQNGGHSIVGTDVALSPPLVFFGRLLFGSWLIYNPADIGSGAPITVTYLGSARVFLPLGIVSVYYLMATRDSTSAAIAMPWE